MYVTHFAHSIPHTLHLILTRLLVNNAASVTGWVAVVKEHQDHPETATTQTRDDE